MSRRPAPPRGLPSASPPPRRAAARPGERPVRAEGAPSRGAATEAEPRPVRLARLISVRALVLGVVLLVGFTLLFPTVRAALAQRAELDTLQAEVTAAEQREQDLRADLDRWSDPAYVAAQARGRLNYVRLGETSYRVIDPEVVVEETPAAGTTTGSEAGPTLPTGGAVAPWYTTVWDSVRIAGEAEVALPGADG